MGRAGGPPTVNDVAAHAGVSRQTVSNVLNAPDRVRAATRERVEAAIVDLGFRRSRSARNLRARRTHLLGYRVAPAPSGAINIVLDRFLHALTDRARDAGHQLLLFTSPDGAEQLDAYDDLVHTEAVDGFVLSETNYGDPRVDHLLDRQVPFAVFGRSGSARPHPWVDVDNAAGTRLAVEHLVAAGRRRIAFVGWPPGSITGDERVRGYRDAVRAAGLEVHDHLDVRGEDGTATGVDAAHRWFTAADPPDAVVAASDLLAIGVLQGAREHGVEPGRDLGVTGFDDTPTAAFLTPALTSVRQPIETVARRIVDELLAAVARTVEHDHPHQPTDGHPHLPTDGHPTAPGGHAPSDDDPRGEDDARLIAPVLVPRAT